jgi:hypothetical protein
MIYPREQLVACLTRHVPGDWRIAFVVLVPLRFVELANVLVAAVLEIHRVTPLVGVERVDDRWFFRIESPGYRDPLSPPESAL